MVREGAARALDLPVSETPLFFSTETGEGVAELWKAIEEYLRVPAPRVKRGGARVEVEH
jgi:hypothetical protein